MLEPGRELDFAEEAFVTEDGGQLGMEHLERDRSVVLQIMGKKYRGHATAAELMFETVALGEGGPETGQGVDQGWLEALWNAPTVRIAAAFG